MSSTRCQPRPGDAELARRFAELPLQGLRAHFMRWTRDEARVADLLQETLLRAWDRRGLYDPARPLSAWVFRIGVNTLISTYRRQELEQRILSGRREREGWADPLTSAQQREDLERIRAELPALPPRQRLALCLHYEQGLSRAEIAAKLDTTPNAISLLLHKARRKLRERLCA